MQEARLDRNKKFAFLSSPEEIHYFDYPLSCLRHVLNQGGHCGSECTLTVTKPVGLGVLEYLQTVTAPASDKTSTLLNNELFAVEPSSATTKQRSTSSLGRAKASSSKLVIVRSSQVGQNGLEEHLYHAAITGNQEALRTVLTSPDKPDDLNMCLPHPPGGGVNMSPLSLAALSGSVACMEMLIITGADVNWQDKDTGYTALHWASIGGVKTSVKHLVKKNADVNKRDNQGFTSLHYGVMQGAEIVSSFCQHQATTTEGVVLVQHPPTGVSPLMLAALMGGADCLKVLLRYIQSHSLIQHVDAQGLSVLHYAAWSKVVKCVKVVTSYSALPLSLTDHWGRTALHHAAATGSVDVLQLLMKRGADVCLRDKSRMTCLHWAVMSSDVTCVRFLMEHKDTHHLVVSCDDAGLTLLHYAVTHGNSDVIDLLVSKGVDVSAVDDMCFSVLLWAAAFLRTELAKQLVEKGVDVHLDQSDSSHVQTSQSDWIVGLQPIHVAARVGSKELCEVFLDNGAIVNCCSNYSYTPLHHASYYGHSDVVGLLLSKGATVDYLTDSDETSLHLASSRGHTQTVQLLIDHGADKMLVEKKELNSPAHLAAIHGHADTLSVLLASGVAVDLTRGTDDRTLLHLAALNGHSSCVSMLLQQGASVTSRDGTREGCTPLDLAMLHNQTACEELLNQHHAPSGGGKFYMSAICIQTGWRAYKKKTRQAAARTWAAHVILRCYKLWISKTRAAKLRRVRERVRHHAATLIQQQWRAYCAAKRRYESSYLKLKARLQQEQLAAQLIMKELLEQEKNIRLPPASSKLNSSAPISALRLLRTSQPSQRKTLPDHQTQGLHKTHTSLKKKHESKYTVRPHSQKKLNSYIHHVVVNNLPPTVQVGGAVINSPRLPLPPIPLPYTAPPTITTSKSHTSGTKKIAVDEEICVPQSVPKLHLSDSVTEVTDVGYKDETDHVSQTTSTISVGSNELVPVNSNENNNNNVVPATGDNPFTTDHGIKSSSSVNENPAVIEIKSIKLSSSKVPKKSLGHIKKLPTRSSPPASTVKSGKHKTHAPTSGTTGGSTSKDDQKLPVLRNRSVHQSSTFDALLRNASKSPPKSDHNTTLDSHVDQLHNCAERHQKLQQVLSLLEQAHQQGNMLSTKGDVNVMDMTELKQHLNVALNEAVRLRAETDSLKTTHEELQQVT
ncbi:inversin-like isoform X2 [Dysidea avara]|uniref:inversin-like isoform X2 n=1 Tax=Dysidea avara TaxID=196820 RepID=UPI00332CB9D2